MSQSDTGHYNLTRIFTFLSRRTRARSYFSIFLFFAAALSDTFGVASVIPLISFALDEERAMEMLPTAMSIWFENNEIGIIEVGLVSLSLLILSSRDEEI